LEISPASRPIDSAVRDHAFGRINAARSDKPFHLFTPPIDDTIQFDEPQRHFPRWMDAIQ
jgi:hypothetical protein